MVWSVVCLVLGSVLGLTACDATKQKENDYRLNFTELNLNVGDRERLELSGNGVIFLQGVEWYSSAEAVATVDNGRVEAVGAGEAAITAIYHGESYTCSVTVLSPRTVQGDGFQLSCGVTERLDSISF